MAGCGTDPDPDGGTGGSSGFVSAGSPGVGGSGGASGGAGAAAAMGGTAGSVGVNAGAGGDPTVPTSGAGGQPPAGDGGEGGQNEAGAGGASIGGGSSVGCDYKLCEDFETGEVGAAPEGWEQFIGYGPASAQDQTLSTEEFHSGAMALKSVSAQKGISRVQKSLAGLGATASKHWGRIFYKVQSPAAQNPSGVLHVTFVSLMGQSENRVVDIVEAQNSHNHQWLFNNPDDQGGTASGYDWTFDDQWHCAEWFVDVAAKSYRFFSDADEVEEIAFTGQDNQMSDYTSIILGATHYQDAQLTGPFTIWFDDLAIDDAQIGCE